MGAAFAEAWAAALVDLDSEFAVPITLKARISADGNDVNARAQADASRPDLVIVGVVENRPGEVDLNWREGRADRDPAGRHAAPGRQVRIRRALLTWEPSAGDLVVIGADAHRIAAPPRDDGLGRVTLTLARMTG